MEKVLFVSSFHPAGVGEIGAGEAIAGDSIRKLIADGYAVDVVVVSPKSQRQNHSISDKCSLYHSYDVTLSSTLLALLSNSFLGALCAPWFFTRVRNDVVSEINYLIKDGNYKFVWLDFPSSLGFAAHIKHPDIRYCAHDVVAQRIQRSILKKWISGYVRKVEAALFQRLSHISVLSHKDLGLVRDMGFCGKTTIIELGSQKVGMVDHAVSVDAILKDFEGKTNIVFFGNMRRPENHWSIMWFILSVFLKLSHKNKRAHLWVLGIRPRLSLRLISKIIPRVHVVGAIDDPTLAFKNADVCVAPLLFGAGVKIKVIQMLDAGASVIATPVGGEGVASSDNLIVAEPSALYKTISEWCNKL